MGIVGDLRLRSRIQVQRACLRRYRLAPVYHSHPVPHCRHRGLAVHDDHRGAVHRLRYDTKHNGTNITTILTGAGGFNMVKTYSNGRMAVDWFNHFDRNYQILNYDVSVHALSEFRRRNGDRGPAGHAPAL